MDITCVTLHSYTNNLCLKYITVHVKKYLIKLRAALPSILWRDGTHFLQCTGESFFYFFFFTFLKNQKQT